MRRLLLYAVFLMPLRAEVIDKLAITVEHNVITELGIDEDLRVVALINAQPVNRGAEMRRAAADRLVQRLLIQHEMEISRYPLPSSDEVSIYRREVQNGLGGPARLAELLKSYDLTEATLNAYLTSQLTLLRFIQYRFSPDAMVSETDVDNAYQREQLPGVRPEVMTDTKRAAISQKLVEERTDAALDTWLAESRKQVTIVYLDKALQ